MASVDFRQWFAESELATCPSCQRRTLLPDAARGCRYCLECGTIDESGVALIETKAGSFRATLRRVRRHLHAHSH